MTLIGLHGPAGAGKDTAADFLRTWGFQALALADPIRWGLCAMLGEFGVDEQLLNDRKTKEAVIPGLGKSPRELMQTLGTEWGRQQVNASLWTALAEERILKLEPLPGFPLAVAITDIRFDSEARWLRDLGGKIWRIYRPRSGPGVNPHVSELGLPEDLVDYVVPNIGTIEEFHNELRVAIFRNFAPLRDARAFNPTEEPIA